MKLLADVNVEGAVVRSLRAEGHDVHWLAERSTERELDDPLVLELAFREGWVILTSDREFVGYVFRDQLPTHGVVLLRVALDRAPLTLCVPSALVMLYASIRTDCRATSPPYTLTM